MICREMIADEVYLLNLDAEWKRQRIKANLEQKTGPAWIMYDENGPVCAFGAVVLWNGVGEVWFNLIRKTKIKTIMRTLKKHIDENMKKYNARRIQAIVSCNFLKGHKFADFFGFEPEGVLKKYHPDGSDAIIYARTV